ncbi:MAG: hypothetical protein R2883_04640 [Caldisericia bacterium]
MKKLSIMLALILAISSFSFVSCGGNEDGKLVVDLLTEISHGNWETVFDLSHQSMVFTGPDKDTFVTQMPYYGEDLMEFFKGAEFKVTGVIHEDLWSSEGIPYNDVSRVTVTMSAPTERKGLDEIPITKDFEETGTAEIIVTPDPTDENLTRKVVFYYGEITDACIVQYSIAENEYSSPIPNATVSDPEPGVSAEPKTLEFFDVFDENYQKKYIACVLEIQNRRSSLRIDNDGRVISIDPIYPQPDPARWQIEQKIWGSFVGLSADEIAGFIPPEPKEFNFGPTAAELKEKVAQALKLNFIKNNGYGAYKEKFPFGILSLTKGTQIYWPEMVSTAGVNLTKEMFDGRKVVFIYVSSCGSCMNRAAEVRDELIKNDFPEEDIIFVSKSKEDKLKGFTGRIGKSPLIIDLALEVVSALGLYSTPSMIAVDGNQEVIVSLDSKEIRDMTSFNRALTLIFYR